MGKNKLKHITAHYNPYADILIGKRRKQLIPRGKAPVKGEIPKSVKPARYLGNTITPQNRNQFAKAQTEYFIERYKMETAADREKAIQEGNDEKVRKIDEERFSDVDLQKVAEDFGRYQCNKEQKHYEAWQKGHKFFKFHGNRFPVLTEDMVNKDLVEIERLALSDEEKEEENGNTSGVE